MIDFNQPPNNLGELIQFQQVTSDNLKTLPPVSFGVIIYFLLKCIVILAVEISMLKWRPS